MRAGIFYLLVTLILFQGCSFSREGSLSDSSTDELPTTASENNPDAARAAGTYADPKHWSEATFIGAIHKGNDGFYEARFNGGACPTCYYPPAGADNAWWFFRGVNSGLYSNPKSWSETTYVGAIHRGNTGFYEARFNGSACSTCYYPPAGADNAWWLFRGAHAGTFNDPKSWSEFSYVGAIHGLGHTKRFVSKFNGAAQATHYYPTNTRENAWWHTAASGCWTGRSPVTSLSDLAMADTSQQAKLPEGRFPDIQSLLSKSPTGQLSSLLKGVRPSMLELRNIYEDYQVSSANLIKDNGDFGALIVALRADGSFVAFLDTPENRGTIIGSANGAQTWIKEEKYDYLTPDTVESDAQFEDLSFVADNSVNSLLVDHDCNGRIIVDVLAGFSKSAADRVGDATAFALAQIESANLGLRNSRADTVRLRLVGTQIVNEDYPVTETTLSLVTSIFKNGILESGADMVAGYFNMPTGDAAGGIAYAPGRYSIQRTAQPAAFRHEIGHNVGGGHCNTGGTDNYKFGFSNGTSATFLCGNNVNYYSTPFVLDGSGRPLGNAKTADMTRLWGERAAAMSAYAKSITAPVGVYP
ncbi:hypothetical protein [Pseudomonas agarici]|uniref:hypothetical protein n=2 Tax=Pseudomonas agarici TaxID=46677 RepID=UPI0015A126D9|nr:hypothetical protein [Pseudomonas agarici]NWB93812.1 hypothetical protein [Pseudomonas agarici]